jgi:5-formyltetrahydrofolate cyclo-ligase
MRNLDQLRTQMRLIQRSIPSGERRTATKKIADIGDAFLSSEGRKVVAGYFPVGDEITPLLLMQALFHRQQPLALPKMNEDNEMCFRRWWPGEKVAPGSRGVPEPVDDTDELHPDYLLVPLLGFDTTGHRLGSGDGHYSRAISSLKMRHNTIIMGIGFAEQELGSPLPESRCDGRLDWVITPKGIRGLSH